MHPKPVTRRPAALLGVLAAALAVAMSSAAPPRPRPRPKPKPKPKPKPDPKHPPGKPPIGKPPIGKSPIKNPLKRPVRPVVLGRRRALVIRRQGAKVVIESGGTVVRESESTPVVIKGGTDLMQPPAVSFDKAAACKVVAVRDDCTPVVEIDGKATPVRLIGVEPPLPDESGGRPRRPPISLIAARHFLNGLLSGEWVYVKTDESVAREDEDGKTTAYLYRAPDGLFVNLELVRQGYAPAASGYYFGHQELFAFYESKARSDEKGVWGKQSPPGGRPRPAGRRRVGPQP